MRLFYLFTLIIYVKYCILVDYMFYFVSKLGFSPYFKKVWIIKHEIENFDAEQNIL
jgi:hypothetical protein